VLEESLRLSQRCRNRQIYQNVIEESGDFVIGRSGEVRSSLAAGCWLLAARCWLLADSILTASPLLDR
jgi:hypothetical protein